MKRIARDPLRFDTFSLFSHYLQQTGMPLHDRSAQRRFLDAVKASTRAALASDSFVHGQRTEALFEMVVASLGAVRLLKKEDEGAVFHTLPHPLQPPDFRLILADGSQALVEVKNHHQAEGFDPYVFRRADYVAQLAAYAHEMGCELFFAIYWSRWGLWTLVRERHLGLADGQRVLAFAKAQAVNEMRLLGDRYIGSRAPLRFRAEFRSVSGARRTRTGRLARRQRQLLEVQSLTIHSERGLITNPTEQRIATFLMFYGGWQEGEPQVETDAEGGIVAIEYPVSPPSEASRQEEQGFTVMGSLSTMLSRVYREKTMRKGKVARVRADFRPGEYADLIPPGFNYTQSVLPLWVFELQPNETARETHEPDAGA